MTKESFANRIDQGKSNNLTYSLNGKEGLISIWKHEGSFILTWGECPAGQQYDEATYTRDERHVFATLQQLLDFMDSRNLSTASFAS